MTADQFVSTARRIAEEYSTVYMWGVFGSPVTRQIISAKAAQYPAWYTQKRQAELISLVGLDYFGFDCVGLIKGILWGWRGDSAAVYGGASYSSNGVPDVTADGMIALCPDASADFTGIVPGEAVWIPGHIGIYIGSGQVAEATSRWKNGVQITALGNIGSIDGLETRTWSKHGQLPWVDYSVPEPEYTLEPVYERLADVPGSYRPSIEKLMRLGVLIGISDPDPDDISDNVINVTETYCRVMTTIDRLGLIPDPA